MVLIISSKNKMAIPKEARQQSPQSHTQKMLGLGEQLWQGIDPLEYIRKERDSW